MSKKYPQHCNLLALTCVKNDGNDIQKQIKNVASQFNLKMKQIYGKEEDRPANSKLDDKQIHILGIKSDGSSD